MAKKRIKVTYSCTNEKSIEEVILNLIRSHKGTPKAAIETGKEKERYFHGYSMENSNLFKII